MSCFAEGAAFNLKVDYDLQNILTQNNDSLPKKSKSKLFFFFALQYNGSHTRLDMINPSKGVPGKFSRYR